MAITLETVSRNAACNAVVDQVDAGAAAGKLKVRAGATVLATFTLEDPAFENAGTSAPGIARAFGGDGTNPVSAGNPLVTTGSAAGTADNYQVTDSDDTLYWSGTVTGTGGGGDLELNNTNIAVGQEVRVENWSHNAPA
jgi:hypothetical protein